MEKTKGKYTATKWGQYLDEAEKRIRIQNPDSKAPPNYDAYKKEFIDYMRTYEKKHAAELDMYYAWYGEAISPHFFREHYLLLSEKKPESVKLVRWKRFYPLCRNVFSTFFNSPIG